MIGILWPVGQKMGNSGTVHVYTQTAFSLVVVMTQIHGENKLKKQTKTKIFITT